MNIEDVKKFVENTKKQSEWYREFEKMMESEFSVNRIWSFNDKKTLLTHVEINDTLLTESEIKKITEIKEKFNFKTYNIFAYNEKMLITFYIF